MKIATIISRVLLGLVFGLSGLNGFLQFLPLGPLPPLAGQFMGALVQSHFMTAVLVIEIACGLALVLNRMTPLALTLLGPVVVNIMLFHITMAPAGIPRAAFVTILWLVAAYRERHSFAPLFREGRTERIAVETAP